MALVIGINVGGTFTDGFVADEARRAAVTKSPLTLHDSSGGFLTAFDVGRFDGATSTLNASVTGDVATVGVLTTKGHADSIAIMKREGRYKSPGSDWIPHMVRTNEPAPPQLIREIDERIDHKGSVVVLLDEAGTRRAIRELVNAEARAIAMSRLWSFRNPVHEQWVGELIPEGAPGRYLALPVGVSFGIGDYGPGATTVMHTQVSPHLRSHLDDPIGRTVDHAAAAVYATENAQTAGLVRKVEDRSLAQSLPFSDVAYRNEVIIRNTVQMAEFTALVPAEALGGDGFGSLYGDKSGFDKAGLQLTTYRTQAVGVQPIRPRLTEIPSAGGEPPPAVGRRVFLVGREKSMDALPFFTQTKVGAVVLEESGR